MWSLACRAAIHKYGLDKQHHFLTSTSCKVQYTMYTMYTMYTCVPEIHYSLSSSSGTTKTQHDVYGFGGVARERSVWLLIRQHRRAHRALAPPN